MRSSRVFCTGTHLCQMPVSAVFKLETTQILLSSSREHEFTMLSTSTLNKALTFAHLASTHIHWGEFMSRKWATVYTGYGSAAGSGRRSASHWRSHVSHAPTPLPLLASTLSFLKLYGRRFSKEDHILFIKLLYELVTLPNLEPHMMQNYARLLIQLLRWVWHNTLVYTNTTCLSFSPHSGLGLKHPDRASGTTAHAY